MEWQAIKDVGKPERGKGVLIHLNSGLITIGYWYKTGDVTNWQLFGDMKFACDIDDYVTHWMPLPPAPL